MTGIFTKQTKNLCSDDTAIRLCAYKKNENSHKMWFAVYRYVLAYYAGEVVNAYKFSILTQICILKLSAFTKSFTALHSFVCMYILNIAYDVFTAVHGAQ